MTKRIAKPKLFNKDLADIGDMFLSDPFSVGDVVRLKSGGPLMTVESFDDANKISCIWYAGDYYTTYSFHADALQLRYLGMNT